MTFIRVQKGHKDNDGNYIGGSASLVESYYEPGSGNTNKQRLVESLGQIVFLDSTRKKGTFLSKTRGLVEFDVDSGLFKSVSDPSAKEEFCEFRPAETIFGDSFAVLEMMKMFGLVNILNKVSKSEFFTEKMLCHTVYGVLKNGTKITCDRFIERSFLSSVLQLRPQSLRTDSEYFKKMGEFDTRKHFFREFVQLMRKRNPDFGTACYVDSTPLDNAIRNLPTNRLCSHGLDSVGVQTRLALVLDRATGLPVWYDIFPGNVPDVSTVDRISADVGEYLGIQISDLVLDAGYVRKELVSRYSIGSSEKSLIARMPDRHGYGVKTIFAKYRSQFSNGKYHFVRENHTYFGKKHLHEVFGHEVFAYVYLDNENADAAFRDYMSENKEEYDKMGMGEKNWVRYRGGFFILISNLDKTPAEILDDYFGRAFIETVFKTEKEYLKLLPLCKNNEDTVNGKILQDVISTIVYMGIRSKCRQSGRSVSDILWDLQYLKAVRRSDGTLHMSIYNKQAREVLELFGVNPVQIIKSGTYRNSLIFQK